MAATLAKMFSITLVRYFVLAGIPFLVCYILFSPGIRKAKIQARYATRKDFIREILHSVASSFVLSAMAYIVLYTPLRGHTLIYLKISDYPLWWLPVSLVLSLVIHDTYFYWMHRLLHHKRIFRYTHLVHHKSVNPSPWASYSFHILEAIAEGGVILLLAFVLPLTPLTVLLFTLSSFVINVYGHLGYEIMPKSLRNSFLFGMINTSTYHNLHHSRFTGNYGLYFRWWDRMMKTENPNYEKVYDQIQEKRFGKNTPAETSSKAAARV